MSETYQATIHETALGSVRRATVKGGVNEVFIVGPQECTHHLTASEAREAAAALAAVAAEVDPAETPVPQAVEVHIHGPVPFKGQLHVDGMEFVNWLHRQRRIYGRSFG